jgi:hypothetical protein
MKIIFYPIKYLISKITYHLNFKKNQTIKSKRIFIKLMLIMILIHFFLVKFNKAIIFSFSVKFQFIKVNEKKNDIIIFFSFLLFQCHSNSLCIC